MKKNKKLIAAIVAAALIIFSFVSYVVDGELISNGYKPLFCFYKTEWNDGGSMFYYGAGYQIVAWKRSDHKIGNQNAVYYHEGIEIHYLFTMIDPYDGPTVKLQSVDS